MSSPKHSEWSISQDKGAQINHDYVTLSQRIYPIDESTLCRVSESNTLAAAGFSIGSGFFFFAIGVLVQILVFSDTSSDDFDWGPPLVVFAICAAAAFLAICLGIWMHVKRLTVLKEIKSRSKSDEDEMTRLLQLSIPWLTVSSTTKRKPGSESNDKK